MTARVFDSLLSLIILYLTLLQPPEIYLHLKLTLLSSRNCPSNLCKTKPFFIYVECQIKPAVNSQWTELD